MKAGRAELTSKPFCRSNEAVLKQSGPSFHRVDGQGIRVMWYIINAIYEEYCQAKLDEMSKLDAVK